MENCLCRYSVMGFTSDVRNPASFDHLELCANFEVTQTKWGIQKAVITHLNKEVSIYHLFVAYLTKRENKIHYHTILKQQEDHCRQCHSLAQQICARILLASLARVFRFALMKILKKCVLINQLINYGQRSFSYTAPKLWNTLPSSLRFSISTASFKCQLKTYLFKQYVT